MANLPKLTSASQLRAVPLQTKWVKVPEWGVEVLVSELTGAEVEAWRQSLLRKGKVDTSPRAQRLRTARFLCQAIRDEDGRRIYADQDADMILSLGSGGMERLAKVALRLSGLGAAEEDEDDDYADEDMSEAEANLGADRNGSSISGSPLSSVPGLSPIS